MYLFIDESQKSYEDEFSIYLKKLDRTVKNKFKDVYFGFGGFCCPNNSVNELKHDFCDLKNEYFDNPFLPIKNNFINLKEEYDEEVFETVSNNIEDFRFDLFELLNSYEEINFIISLINIIGNDKKILPFNNIIQRFSWEARLSDQKSHSVVLDWNQKVEIEKFNRNYNLIYLNGEDEYNNPNTAGELISLGFQPSLHYAVMVNNDYLQIADFIIGSFMYLFKEFVKEYDNDNIDELKENEKYIKSFNLLMSSVRKHKGDPFSGGLIFNSYQNCYLDNFEVFIKTLNNENIINY